MLYHLLYPLHKYSIVFNVFQYITFRTTYASLTALLISLLLGPWLIRRLKEFQIGQQIRREGPSSHLSKAGTPTMGGILILISTLVPTLLWADLTDSYVWIAVFSALLFSIIGFSDDYLKLVKEHSRGLSGKKKLGAQIAIGLGLCLALILLARGGHYSTRLSVPFFKRFTPDLNALVINGVPTYLPFVFFIILVIVGCSNAVNLTDGLDGLAAGCVVITTSVLAILTYVTGHATFAAYLGLIKNPHAGELTIFCGAMAGATLGFLWYNSHPAEIFMGDVGSLALGGAIGTVAVLIKQELLLLAIGGIFVVEALSVIFQVVSFKVTGKRILLMAPLHHHFELLGWKESKIVVRFWITAVLFALFSLTTLKLR